MNGDGRSRPRLQIEPNAQAIVATTRATRPTFDDARLPPALSQITPQKPIASHDGVYPPEPDTPQNSDDPTSFQIGEMKVQVHGYISYAVGFGKPMPGRGSRNN